MPTPTAHLPDREREQAESQRVDRDPGDDLDATPGAFSHPR
jgi:hypothetical protein